MTRFLAVAGFVSAVRGGVLLGDFLAVAQRAILVLAETCQTAFFDPILLSCAKKSGVEPPRRSCLGLLRCGAAPTKGPRPF